MQAENIAINQADNFLKKEDLMDLGSTLGDAYADFFKDERIEDLYKQILSLSKTQINLATYFKHKEGVEYLFFEETIKFIVNEQTYIVFSLNGNVQEFVIEGSKQHLTNLNILPALEILMLKNISVDITPLLTKLQQLILTSHIYNYALNKLEQQISNKMDVIRAGMFKNAYYNIIALKNQEYINLLVGIEFQAKIR